MTTGRSDAGAAEGTVEGREQEIVDTFVTLADSLVADFDVRQTMDYLVARCVHLLDVDVAGLLLADRTGELQAFAATSQDMEQLELFELSSAEGPSYEAYRTGRQVVVPDLGACAGAWPRFVPRALELGFHAGYGFPLRLRERALGAFNLYQREGRRTLADTDIRVARGFADAATIALVQEELFRGAKVRIDQLEHALEVRVLIEQAKGVLAERHSIAPMEAYERIRQHARSSNRKARDIAEAVIAGRLEL